MDTWHINCIRFGTGRSRDRFFALVDFSPEISFDGWVPAIASLPIGIGTEKVNVIVLKTSPAQIAGVFLGSNQINGQRIVIEDHADRIHGCPLGQVRSNTVKTTGSNAIVGSGCVHDKGIAVGKNLTTDDHGQGRIKHLS